MNKKKNNTQNPSLDKEPPEELLSGGSLIFYYKNKKIKAFRRVDSEEQEDIDDIIQLTNWTRESSDQ